MNEVKMIFFDLDGTALLSDKQTIPQRLLKVLDLVYKRNIEIIPITGRPYFALPDELYKRHEWSSIIIVNNGAQCLRLESGEVMFSEPIDKDLLIDLTVIAEQMDIPIELNTHDNIVLTEKSFLRLKKFGTQSINHHLTTAIQKNGCIVDKLSGFFEKYMDVFKLTMPYVEEEKRHIVLEDFRRLKVSAVMGNAVGIEVTSLPATKANGLKRACEYFHIAPENCLAFGDSGNDITMLEFAGVGVAMGNSL